MRIKLRQHKEGWHPWFAWYPVFLDSGEIAWLETVERLVEVDFRLAHVFKSYRCKSA